jgi:hypothetical protein
VYVIFEIKSRAVSGFQDGADSSFDLNDASLSIPRHWQREVPDFETELNRKIGEDGERGQWFRG